ncbi:Uncharacterized protein HZ326_13558 [Fusarium oxysporum f. sp. albedinis]|nr:Uncharacterized protein HZ326_13558 [Fusarium oxysporum f. sp. albedinis]
MLIKSEPQWLNKTNDRAMTARPKPIGTPPLLISSCLSHNILLPPSGIACTVPGFSPFINYGIVLFAESTL